MNVLLPESLAQLPALFAESVENSCTSVLGDSPGEALVRRIGDDNLMVPDLAYGRIDAFFSGGSELLKERIRQSFREGVHRLYRIAMNIEKNLAADSIAGYSGGIVVRVRVTPRVRRARSPTP